MRWTAVLLYVAAIYLTIPYAQHLWTAARAFAGVSFSSLAFYPLATTGGVVLVAAIYRTRADAIALIGLAALGSAYYYLYGHVFQAPAEKLHLLEYGLLSWIIWWAWRPGPNATSWAATGVWILNAAFGTADELIQHYTPGRVGEVRDVMINWESAALGLGVLMVMARPWRRKRGSTGSQSPEP